MDIPYQLDEVCCFFVVMMFGGAVVDWFTRNRNMGRRRF
jgi:hypothetical protein